MTKNSSMRVEAATEADLDFVLSWLEREYREDGEGFWSNRNIIRAALSDDELWVVREGGEAVAFQVGKYAADIACVRKDRQRSGYGTALFKASLARAMADDVNVMFGECAPVTSLPFWQKHGFQRCGDMSEWGRVTVRRILHHQLEVPAGLPPVEVVITFYPEAASYPKNVQPISAYRLVGSRCDNGEVMLPYRVIELKANEPERRDLVVKIEVDGVQVCFAKAKYEEAKAAGVRDDYKGGAFFVDVVRSSD